MDAPALRNKFARLGPSYDEAACRDLAAEIDAVLRLKKEKDAVILAHNYQRPEIFEVADFAGDSLELSREAAKVSAANIVFCGVHFMAETAKILCPDRRVVLPNLAAGCTLAEAATAESVERRAEELRKVHPDLAVVAYINTTAEVKAVSDICVTSGNAVKIVNAIPNSAVLLLPDRNLAAFVGRSTSKTVIPWDGDCCVHDQLFPFEVQDLKAHYPGAPVLVHPECRPEIVDLADEVLSTSGMLRRVRSSEAREFILVTERGVAEKLTLDMPGKSFYTPCGYCRFMKMITLPDTRRSLERLAPEITVAPEVAAKARRAIERMLELS